MEPPSADENKSPTGTPARAQEELPYTVELRQIDANAKVERVLARAANAPLARAIFKVAQDEHPQRRITLRRGNRILADTSSPAPSVRS